MKYIHKYFEIHVLWPADTVGYFIIKTHGSESRGQEEAGLRDERVNYLQVASWGTAVNFVNALNKPPLKLSLSYQRLSTF